MKTTKKQLFVSIISIAITLVSLIIMLCDFFVPLNIWIFPVLTFLFCMFVGFGGLCLGLGIINRSPWHFFISSILIGLALIYALLQYIPWWIGVVCVVVLWIVVAILCFIVSGSKTESIALNKSPEYKTYEQRRAEKLQEESEKEPEELPEIKSFK